MRRRDEELTDSLLMPHDYPVRLGLELLQSAGQISIEGSLMKLKSELGHSGRDELRR